MEYLKTYEQIKDFYNLDQSKFLIVSKDKKWYLKGFEGNDSGEAELYPISELDKENINSNYLIGEADSNDFLYDLSKKNIIVYLSKMNYLKANDKELAVGRAPNHSIHLDSHYEVDIEFKRIEYLVGVVLKKEDPNIG